MIVGKKPQPEKKKALALGRGGKKPYKGMQPQTNQC